MFGQPVPEYRPLILVGAIIGAVACAAKRAAIEPQAEGHVINHASAIAVLGAIMHAGDDR